MGSDKCHATRFKTILPPTTSLPCTWVFREEDQTVNKYLFLDSPSTGNLAFSSSILRIFLVHSTCDFSWNSPQSLCRINNDSLGAKHWSGPTARRRLRSVVILSLLSSCRSRVCKRKDLASSNGHRNAHFFNYSTLLVRSAFRYRRMRTMAIDWSVSQWRFCSKHTTEIHQG